MKLWPTVKNVVQAKVPGMIPRVPRHHPYCAPWCISADSSPIAVRFWWYCSVVHEFLACQCAKCVEEHRFHLNFYFRNSDQFVVLRLKRGKGYSWQLLTGDFGFGSTAFTAKSYISNHIACLNFSLHSPKLKDTTFQKSSYSILLIGI